MEADRIQMEVDRIQMEVDRIQIEEDCTRVETGEPSMISHLLRITSHNLTEVCGRKKLVIEGLKFH